jgi:N-acetylmuramoyl-L-alanine amidase
LNFNIGRRAPIDTIVIHTTGSPDVGTVLKRYNEHFSQVSAHYVIDTDGTIHQVVKDKNVAFHATGGRLSSERSVKNPFEMNNRSLGIQLVNDGTTDFTRRQMSALVELTGFLKQTYQVPKTKIVDNSDLGPGRVGLGDRFSWAQLLSAMPE